MTRPTADEVDKVLALVADEARAYLDGIGERTLRGPGAEERADSFLGALPEEGDGALTALRELFDRGMDAAVTSAGPRFFHFVQGGVTPAALGADWLTSTLDQNAGLWTATPLGTQMSALSVRWLKDLFGLPEGWDGVLTTGATMANFAALACARRWWAGRHDVDADADGLGALPKIPVLSGGSIHPSARKALGMLGMGRDGVRTFSADGTGRLDLAALTSALKDLGGEPAIVVANAGEVNAGRFDPIAEMAGLAEEHDAWLHVDGAFGLFAALSPRTSHLTEGMDRAHSVISDGHKWLNVPYDCGFAFVRDPDLLRATFSSSSAAYLTGPGSRRSNTDIGPEMSQRARGIAVWATLRAYGRSGYRGIVERHLDLAQRVAARVDEAPDLERLAEVPLNIVCFRHHPPGLDDEEKLNHLNARLGEMVLEDGRVYVGTTSYDGRTAFRPAIVNWRTSEADVDLLVDVIRELGASLQR